MSSSCGKYWHAEATCSRPRKGLGARQHVTAGYKFQGLNKKSKACDTWQTSDLSGRSPLVNPPSLWQIARNMLLVLDEAAGSLRAHLPADT